MPSSVIGALRVTLGVDTAAFDKGLKGANKSLAVFGRSMAKTGAVIGVALAATVVGLGVAVVRTIGQIDDLGKTAQKIGIPIEELSKLKHAAELSGVSMGTLSTGIQRLSRNMFDMATLGTGEGADAFRAVGVAVADANGEMRSASEVMASVADKFAGMKDGANKTALAMKLFGKSGAEMIPLLNAGSAGLKEMMREAEKLGLVLDGKTFKAAELFNDSMLRLGKSWDGIITQITIALAPALSEVAAQFAAMATNSDIAKRIGNSLSSVLSGALPTVIRFASELQILAHSISTTASIISQIDDSNFSGAWDTFKEGRKESSRLRAETDAMLVRMKLYAEFMASGFGPAVEGTGAALGELTTKITAQKKAMDEGKRVFEDTRTPAEALKKEFERLNELLQRGAIDFETYARAIEKAQDAFDDFKESSNEALGQIKEMTDSVASSMTDAFADFAENGKLQFKDLARSIINDLTRIAIKQALMPVSNSVAQGLGALFSVPGFAHGGSILPGGAGGGIDSQLVTFRKSPQERVDIYTPGQGGGSGGGISVPVTVNIDARGADRDGMLLAVQKLKAEVPSIVVSTIRDQKSRRVL